MHRAGSQTANTHTKKKPLASEASICLYGQCFSPPVWSTSMGNRVYFITVPVLFTLVTPATTIWLAFLLQHLLWTTEDKMVIQQSSSLFTNCSCVPGHGYFHTSCGQCPCTHQPCPRLPSQADPGTVPEYEQFTGLSGQAFLGPCLGPQFANVLIFDIQVASRLLQDIKRFL